LHNFSVLPDQEEKSIRWFIVSIDLWFQPERNTATFF